MSKKITLNEAETAATVESATLLDPLLNLANPNVTFTGLAKYTLPVVAAGVGAMVVNKRHSGAYLNFGGAQ